MVPAHDDCMHGSIQSTHKPSCPVAHNLDTQLWPLQATDTAVEGGLTILLSNVWALFEHV